MYRSNPEQTSEGIMLERLQMFGDEMRTMQQTILTIQQTLEGPRGSHSGNYNKREKSRCQSNHRTVKNEVIQIQRQDLPYLDLAVVYARKSNNIALSPNVVGVYSNLSKSCVTLNC